MANYYCSCRTNYFEVKDLKAFKEWCGQYPVQFITGDGNLVGLIGDDPNGGSWPTYNDDTDEDIAFAAELSEHLADNSVAILMEAGSEKSRYVIGYAVAINAAGERLVISIDDIYALVKTEWGVVPTRAEY